MKSYRLIILIAVIFCSTQVVQAQLAVSPVDEKSKTSTAATAQATSTFLQAILPSSFIANSEAARSKSVSQIQKAKQFVDIQRASIQVCNQIAASKWRTAGDAQKVMTLIDQSKNTTQFASALQKWESALSADALNGFWKTQRNTWMKDLKQL